MIDAAAGTDRLLIEAFHYRFHPAFGRLLELVANDSIGKLRHIESRFDVPVAFDASEIRYDPLLGGGAMMDLGCYPVHWARTVSGEEPTVERARATMHASGVDIGMEAELSFPGGLSASVSCSMAEDLPDRVDALLRLTGEGGSLEMTNPLIPHVGCDIIVTRADDSIRESFAGDTTYHYQLAHVCRVINGQDEPVTGGTDAVHNMRVLDEIYRLAGAR